MECRKMSEVIHHHIHYIDPSLMKSGFNIDFVSAAQKVYNEEKSAPVEVPQKILDGAWVKNTQLKKKDSQVSIIDGLS